jgi:alkylhydroperoxidase family enzyme
MHADSQYDRPMPRLGQISRSDENPPIVKTMYSLLFEDRDPVADPGTSTGTSGDWWTVWANSPDVLEHAVAGFGLYASPDRKITPALRELGQIRAGWVIGSQFVFSQHCKSCRGLGYSEEKIEAIKHWQVSDLFDPLERALLAYTDALVSAHGRVADGVFEVLKEHLSDEAILEFTYITMTYALHAVMSVALRTEFDDREDPTIEVAAPEGYQAANIGRDISGRDDAQ